MSVNATAEMLIRKPVRDVFDAFVNPRSLERFWLKSASGPLAKDTTVEWEFQIRPLRSGGPTVSPSRCGLSNMTQAAPSSRSRRLASRARMQRPQP